MFKRISIEQCQKIQNLVRVAGENGFENEENVDFLIAQAIPILYGEDFKPDLSTNKKKINFKTKVMADIDETLKRYRKYKEKKQNNDKIYISFKGKNYISDYINIKTYFYINNKITDANQNEINEHFWNSLGEEVLLMLFSNTILAEDFEEIKFEDPIYYEIIIDDVIALILKELKEIAGIKRILKPYGESKESKLIELKETEEEAIYSLFLENYSIMPEDLNKNRAYDILKTLSTISNRAIAKEIEKDLKDVNDPIMKEAMLAEIEEALK